MANEIVSDICDELENRFLTYALSTIVSRSLPDVRDGLKPIHRRILYAMHSIGLSSATRHVKSAKIIGEVLGKFHPHGDASTYEAMARLAQDFSMRYPLVDGKGNFGSVDGDSPAAYRYTEGRLTPITAFVLNDIKKETVDFKPNYDNTINEPVVLPSRIPNLLINGSSGIAVGMACSFPSHNLTEILNGLCALIDEPGLSVPQLMKHIKGPDFYTEGMILNSKTELRKIYEEGAGSIKIRGEWKLESLPRGKTQIILTSIPYGVNKARLVEKIAEIIITKKLSPLLDVRDESDEAIRMVLEIKSDADPEKIMAYVIKHTDFDTNFPVNFTCLKPNGEPGKLSLLEICRYFLDFRKEVVTRRFNYELSLLVKRLHILAALEIIFSNLDKALKLIRSSKSRAEAHGKLRKQFKLDDEQTDAILEIPLYRLVGLEIDKILDEKNEKTKEKKRIESILKSPKKIWSEVRDEFQEILKSHGDKRRSKIRTLEVLDFNPEDFVEHEDVCLILSQNGWLRKMKSVGDPASLKFRENDSLMSMLRANTRDLAAYFTSRGMVYVQKIHSIPFTRGGFGEPIQNNFKFVDGERLVAVLALKQDNGAEETDASPPDDTNGQQAAFDFSQEVDAGSQAMVANDAGYGFLFPLSNLSETTRAGKRAMSLQDDSRMLGFEIATCDHVFLATQKGKGVILPREEITVLNGVGRGIKLIKLKDDVLVGFKFVSLKDTVELEFEDGSRKPLSMKKVPVYNRGCQGVIISKRKNIKRIE